MIKKELTELQARLMYKMQIYKWSNRNRNIMNEMDLIRKKIPFFYINAGRLAVSGFIKTIDGDYEVYVIGIKNVLRKISLQYELPDAIIKRKRRIRNRNIWIIIFQGSELPEVLIQEILSFSP
jgi:hypothetical protein